MTEDQLEQETLGWLADTGYSHRYGLDIAPDGFNPERSSYNQVLLVGRLREAINRKNLVSMPMNWLSTMPWPTMKKRCVRWATRS